MGASLSRRLSSKFVETWTANHGNVEVETLDLVIDPLPHLGPDWVQGSICPPAERTPEMAAAMAISDRLIEQLEAADIVVIGAPMINFGLCTQLKSWFDYVTLAGRTFESLAPGQARGLLFGKKVFVVKPAAVTTRRRPRACSTITSHTCGCSWRSSACTTCRSSGHRVFASGSTKPMSSSVPPSR